MARIFDIVECPNMGKYEIIRRFPSDHIGNYRLGSQVIVHNAQVAMFFHNNDVLGVFRTGHHIITTANFPKIADLIGEDFDDQVSFSAEVYFVNMMGFADEKWGTPDPILVGNAKLGFTYIQGWGFYSFRVSDPEKFIEKAVINSGIYRSVDIEERLKSKLLTAIDESINELCEQNDLKMAAEAISFKKEISAKVIIKSKPYFESWGLSLDDFSFYKLIISPKSSELLQDTGLPTMPATASISAIPVDANFIFVIMSFDKHLDPVYHSFKTAASMVGLDAQRVSDQLGDYRITDKIIENIRKAFLIIADLSLERPNVYFELGYARGLGKTVVETALEGTNLHFDIKDWTCIFYSLSDQDTLINSLKERLKYEITKNR